MASDFPIPPFIKGDTRSLLEANTANEVVRNLNKVLTVEIRFVNTGGSKMEVSGENAVLFISTKDINLGTLTGSKGSNAALGNLISILSAAFTLNNQTT